MKLKYQHPIFIPSSNRAHIQFTLQNFTPELRKLVKLVVQENQEWDYEEVAEEFGCELLILPSRIKTISPTREWICSEASAMGYEKFFITDDDLKFAYREFSYLGDKKLTPCNNSPELNRMYETLCEALDEFAHVGISARSGNNHNEETFAENVRMMCITGYQSKVTKKMLHNRVKIRSDFDLVLQMIRSGYRNWVSYEFCHDQPGSNTEGGCSVFRDAKMLEEEANKLAELHSGFVRVSKKTTKADWGVGGERTDVTIYWKKAFEKGQYKKGEV